MSKICWLAIAVIAAMVSVASAQQLPSYIEKPSDAAGVFAIWPGSGVPPGSEKWTWHEQSIQLPGSKVPDRLVRNVVISTVTVYKPLTAGTNRTALIVAPGGAFNFLMMDNEGYDFAHWLAQRGITAFVLRYRVAHSPENNDEFGAFVQNLLKILPRPEQTTEAPPMGGDNGPGSIRSMAEEDGRQAIRFVRQHASEWDIDPNRIGIAGLSWLPEPDHYGTGRAADFYRLHR